MPRGQAIVEFALILPLLLLLILGSLQVGVALMVRSELSHAVREAAVAGATAASQPERCPAALAALVTVFGRDPETAHCTPATGNAIEVSAAVDLPLFIPGPDVWRISVTERAIIRSS